MGEASVLDRFNNVYQQFLEDLNKTFKVKTSILPEPDKKYLEEFVQRVLPYMDNVSVCNEDFFNHSKDPVLLVVGKITFHQIFTHSEYRKKNTKISFWKYLHALYLLSTKLTDNVEKIISGLKHSDLVSATKCVLDSRDTIINNLKKYRPDIVFTHDTLSPEDTKAIQHTTQRKKDREELKEMEDSMNESSDFFSGSLIGQLASDLSKEVNPADFKDLGNPADLMAKLFGGGLATSGTGADSNFLAGGLGNIMATVCNKMDEKIKSGELNQHSLMMEAQKLMGGLNLFPPGGMPPRPNVAQPSASPNGMPMPPNLANMTPDQLRQMGMQMGMMNMMATSMQGNPKTRTKNSGKSCGENKKGVIRRKKK